MDLTPMGQSWALHLCLLHPGGCSPPGSFCSALRAPALPVGEPVHLVTLLITSEPEGPQGVKSLLVTEEAAGRGLGSLLTLNTEGHGAVFTERQAHGPWTPAGQGARTGVLLQHRSSSPPG